MTPQDLADLIGEDDALKLLSMRGGSRIYVPKRVSPYFREQCGAKGAEALVSIMGGSFLVLPVGKNWRAVVMRRKGVSVPDIALSLGLGERAVWHALALANSEGRFQRAIKNGDSA